MAYAGFDATFFNLPVELQRRIQAKIDEMGRDLAKFPHRRLTGGNRYRLRVGDYRVIYALDLNSKTIHLLALGHRREIYKNL